MLLEQTYEQINRTEWTRLVNESTTGTWFQSPEAYVFYASQHAWLTPFAVGISRENALVGVCVGYVTKERNKFRQFFTRRAIIIGGPVLADDCSPEEVCMLMKAVHRRLEKDAKGKISDAPIYIETRNLNDYSSWKGAFEEAGFHYKKHLNFHVNCTVSLEDNLSDNRRRQLKKSHSVSELAVDESEVREWYAILTELYRTKVKTPLWPVEFYIQAYRQGTGRFLLVKHKGKIIGGSMTVSDKRCVYEWFECGLNAEYKDQYPSVLATYAGMSWAKEHGHRRYDMMGAGEPDVPYGVRDFKREFGGEMVEQGRFCYVNKPLLYTIGVWGVRMLKGKNC